MLIGGLDLGKKKDFSVLAVVDRARLPVPVAKRRYSYALRWLQTWELGTRYTATNPGEPSIIGDVRGRYSNPVLRRSPLAVDYTGVGVAVFEQLQAARVPARLHPVVTTSGHAVSTPEETKDGSWHVPKAELVGTMVVMLENDLLKWQAPGTPGALPLVGRFEGELGSFREIVTRKKNLTYGAEASQHDDLVMAVALACWLGEHVGSAGGLPGTPDERQANCIAGAPDGVFAGGNGV